MKKLFSLLLLFYFTGNGQLNYYIKAGKFYTASYIAPEPPETSDIATFPALPVETTPTTPPDEFEAGALGTPAIGSPVIVEWTRDAGPGNLISISGSGLENATFKLWDGATLMDGIAGTYSAQTQTRGVRIPNFSQKKMYVLWPVNSFGIGAPILINRTEAWWTKKYAAPGGSSAVYGRNLSHTDADWSSGGTAPSYVYIKSGGGTVTQCTVTGVTPYKVSFTVPAVSNGTYQVWVHNGWGGDWGWSRSEDLTVYTPITWANSGASVFVPTLNNNGSTDNTAALQAAINSANSYYVSNNVGATVDLRSYTTGSMAIFGSVQLKSGVRILGNSGTTTILKYTSTGSRIWTSNPTSNVKLENIQINVNQQVLTGNAVSIAFVTHASLESVRIEAKGFVSTNPLELRGTNISVNSCHFNISRECFFTDLSNNIFITNNTFKGNDDLDMMIITRGNRSEYYNNNCSDYDNTTTNGIAKGRFLVIYPNFFPYSSSYYFYIANNTTTDFGPRFFVSKGASLGTPDGNSGETVLWEAFSPEWSGTSSTNTATTVSTGATGVGVNNEVLITDGLGAGQRRTITNNSGGVLTVSPAWTIIPNASSVMIVGRMAHHNVMYKNDFQAKQSGVNLPAHEHVASTGYNAYGNVFDLTADRNTYRRMRTGFVTYPINENGRGVATCFYHLNRNTTMIGCYDNILFQYYTNSLSFPKNSTGALGIIVREATITSPVRSSIMYITVDNSNPKLWNTTIIENGNHSNTVHYKTSHFGTPTTTPSGIENQIIYNTPIAIP